MDFERAMQLDPENVEALVGKGQVLTYLRRPEEAVEIFNRALFVIDTTSRAVGMSRTQCWACAFGITRVGKVHPPYANIEDILGVCVQCGVFGCSYHAERDRNGFKWVCFPSVARALSVAAGLDTPDPDDHDGIRPRSSRDFERRYPVIAEATAEQRARWREQGQRLVAEAIGSLHRTVDPDLLADAVGVGQFLLREVPENVKYGRIGPEEAETERPLIFALLPDRLGILVLNLPERFPDD